MSDLDQRSLETEHLKHALEQQSHQLELKKVAAASKSEQLATQHQDLAKADANLK